jgi:hypothetical protein
MISQSVTGLMENPISVTGDGTNLYVLDNWGPRIEKYNIQTGAFIGWIGWISSSPTGPVGTSCVGATGFTPGWCVGGTPTGGGTYQGLGEMNNSQSITYAPSTGYLYVFDQGNMRVASYSATSGAFEGWIGRENATPTSCSGGATSVTRTYNGNNYVYTNGWCMGGSAQSAINGADPGGGFNNNGTAATDNTYLYVANQGNGRIDKFNLSSGQYVASMRSRPDLYTSGWETSPTNYGNDSWQLDPFGMWTDGVNLYATIGSYYVAKYSLQTGNVVGWKGAIAAGASLVAPADCVGATGFTPDWCQSSPGSSNGAMATSLFMGGFNNSNFVTGDANYIYISDSNNNRITRLPK